MKEKILILPLAFLAVSALAAPKTFTLGGPRLEARQVASVESEAEFENFVGRTGKVGGTLVFDPAKRTGSGTVTVDLASLDTGIPMRNEHMRGDGWLNTVKFPTATFRTTGVKPTGKDAYRVMGQFTLRGVTRPVVANATVRYAPQSAASRQAGLEGDAVQLRTQFKIRLSDYGITVPPAIQGKVANVVSISIVAWGVTG